MQVSSGSLMVPAEVQENAFGILEQVILQIPQSAQGLERLIFIGDSVEKLPVENKMTLKFFIDSLLLRMFILNASDIDMGGYGGQGRVWYRIFGSKKPDPTLESLSTDKTNVLIQSLLTSRQRQYLYEQKNLDFSYMIM